MQIFDKIEYSPKNFIYYYKFYYRKSFWTSVYAAITKLGQKYRNA